MRGAPQTEFEGLVVAVEGQGDGEVGVTRPLSRCEAPPRAHATDEGARLRLVQRPGSLDRSRAAGS